MIKIRGLSAEAIICLVIFACIILKLFTLFLPVRNYIYEEELFCTLLSDGWEQVLEDGARLPVTVPGKINPEHNSFYIETRLPDNLPESSWLSIRADYEDVTVYIDGQPVKKHGRDHQEYTNDATPGYYIFLELSGQESGHTLGLQYWSPVRHYVTSIRDVVLGTQMGIWIHYARRDASAFVIPIVVCMIAASSLIPLLILGRQYRNGRRYIYIALGVILYTSWEIVRSDLRQLVFPNTDAVSDAASLLLPMIGLPFLACLDILQNHRYHISNLFLHISSFVVCITAAFLHYTHLIPYTFSTPVIILILIAIDLYMLITIFIDYVKKQIADYRIMADGYLVLTITTLIGAVLYNFDPTAPSSPVINIGLLILMTSAVIDMLNDFNLKHQEEMIAEQINTSRSEFIAGLSHEIRTPVNSILGLNELIFREAPEPVIHGYAQNIRKSGESLLKLINDILDYSRLESGRISIIEAPYNPVDVYAPIIDKYRTIAQDKGLKFHLNLSGDIPDLIYGDSDKLVFITDALLSNAVRYTAEGTVTLEIDITPEKQRHADGTHDVEFRTCVSDNGGGLTLAELKTIMDPFGNIDENTGESGMGLSIAVGFLKLLGCELNVDATPGHGTDFHYLVRQRTVSDTERLQYISERERATAEALNSSSLPVYTPSLKILCVDDNAMNLTVIQGLLKRTGAIVSTANGGQQAIDAVKQEFYDLILMDHQMPGINGEEAMHRIRSTVNHGSGHNKTIIVVLTANEEQGIRQEYINAGFDDYLSKPVKDESLDNIIRNFFADRIEPVPSDSPEEDVEEHVDEQSDLIKAIASAGILDIDAGIRNCGGADLLENAIRIFVANAPDYMALLQSDVRQSDITDATIKVHAMKSNTRILGMQELSDKAARLEKFGNQYKTRELFGGIPALLKDYESKYEALRNVLNEYEKDDTQKQPENLQDISSEELADAYNSIQECAQSLDFESIEAILVELKAYKLDDKDSRIISEIKKAAANADSTKISQILAEKS